MINNNITIAIIFEANISDYILFVSQTYRIRKIIFVENLFGEMFRNAPSQEKIWSLLQRPTKFSNEESSYTQTEAVFNDIYQN